jgi:hypothetical protein
MTLKRKKLLILHNFGGVGKSTLGACLIHPRVGGELMSIETNNTDAERYGVRVHRYAATQYEGYYRDPRRFSVFGNTLTDVGASNVEAFIDKLIRASGLDQFDYVVVPATQGDRGQIETITTIQTLLDNVGVAPERLRVILNMVKKPGGNCVSSGGRQAGASPCRHLPNGLVDRPGASLDRGRGC